ncbi:hypothetical protein Q3G72_012746 [Acer saccharum]|nr:hypothetical protein Q3G72_012746 [Acer saccharum]
MEDASPDEMWFFIGGKKARFSRVEFCLATGLEFGHLTDICEKEYEVLNNSIHKHYFVGEKNLRLQTIYDRFSVRSAYHKFPKAIENVKGDAIVNQANATNKKEDTTLPKAIENVKGDAVVDQADARVQQIKIKNQEFSTRSHILLWPQLILRSRVRRISLTFCNSLVEKKLIVFDVNGILTDIVPAPWNFKQVVDVGVVDDYHKTLRSHTPISHPKVSQKLDNKKDNK